MMGNYFYDLNTKELLKWETSNEILEYFNLRYIKTLYT